MKKKFTIEEIKDLLKDIQRKNFFADDKEEEQEEEVDPKGGGGKGGKSDA